MKKTESAWSSVCIDYEYLGTLQKPEMPRKIVWNSSPKSPLKKKKKLQLETTFVSCREAITNECITPSRLPRRYCPLRNHFVFHAITLRRCYLSVPWSASILIKTGESSEVKISQGDNIGWDCQLSRLIELLYLTQRFYSTQFLWRKFTQWSRNRDRYYITSFLLSLKKYLLTENSLSLISDNKIK